MTDKNTTRKKRIITTKDPQQIPIEKYPVKLTASLRVKPNPLRDEIIRRLNQGQSLRRIASELGETFAKVTRLAGGVE